MIRNSNKNRVTLHFDNTTGTIRQHLLFNLELYIEKDKDSPMSTHSNTIIIIEDDKQTVALFHSMFRRNCVDLVCISSRELYQLATITQNCQPIVVILDYMSIMHNYDNTLDILDSVMPNIPTIITTTIEDDKLSASFDYEVKKPFYPTDIFMIIQDVVQQNS
jgi:CheY-like chemotaxis protein